MTHTARFILIDPSIAGFSGHHLEYASQVLQAAGQAGYLPVLAANRRLALQESEPFLTHRVYKYGFWTRPLAAGRFSPLSGPCQLVRRFAGNPSMNHWLARTVLWAADCWKRRGSDAIRARQFARDTARLLQQLEVSRGDVVFLPTTGEVELSGLLQAMGRFQGCRQAQWHIAFRRDPPDADHPEAMRRLVRVLRQVCADSGGNIHCYTDTEELSRQYQGLAAVPFQTLPIPHTDGLSAPGHIEARSFRAPARVKGDSPIFVDTKIGTVPPLRILYLGDARREKGYHHLPAVIEDLWTDCVATGRIAFTIQSNLTADEPQVRAARSRLRAIAGDSVTVLTSALSSAEYRRLLLSGDIVLLPYDPAAYRSRSSGILAEALAAGVPAIVPANTWLARQFPTPNGGAASSRQCAGPVGLSFHDIGEVPGLLREMIADYDRYRRSAEAFAVDWVKRHNAGRLIEMLATAHS